jgi:disulfide bond formation protein DsbB
VIRSPAWALHHVYILGIVGVILGGFSYQFFLSELPCPLCMLQRMCMIAAAIPSALALVYGCKPQFYGMSIVAALIGAAISTRQLLTHICNVEDPGYGTPIMGAHAYTWALVVFMTVILVCAINLMVPSQFSQSPPFKRRSVTRMTLWALLLVALANAVASLAIAGFSWFLPDNPTSYLLFG